MKLKSFVILIIILISGCNSNKKQDIKKFAYVYYEIVQNQFYNAGNKEKILDMRKKILNKYQVDDKYLFYMIEYLSNNPSEWQIFENEINNLIKRNQK